MAETVRTPVGLLSFPHLFTARAPAEGAEPRFSINIVFDKEAQATPEFAKLKEEIKKAAIEKWGDKMPSNLRSPVRNAGEKDYEGYNEGDVFIQAWTKNRPGIVNARLTEIVDSSDVWPGQMVRATVRPFAYDNAGNRGVSLGLNNVQITKSDMPRLDGRVSANKDFDAVASTDSSDPFSEKDEAVAAEAETDPFA